MSTTATISFRCPGCGQRIDAPAKDAGTSSQCSRCRKSYVVPMPIAPLPPAPEPAQATAAATAKKDKDDDSTRVVAVLPSGPKPAAKPAAAPAAAQPLTEIAPAGPAWMAKLPAPLRSTKALIGLGAAAAVLIGLIVTFAMMGGGERPRPAPQPQVTASERAALDAEAARLRTERERERERIEREKQDADRAARDKAEAEAALAATKLKVTPDTGAGAGHPSTDELVGRNGPSVVVVTTDRDGTGAGFVAFQPGLIITNHHVIHGAARVTVRYPKTRAHPQRQAVAKVIAVDARNDLALLSADAGGDEVVPLEIADGAGIKDGAEVVVIANPGLGNTILEHSVADGVINAADREIAGCHLIQTSATITPANSGAPVLDLDGRVLGVVSVRAPGQDGSAAVPAARLIELYAGREDKFKVAGDFAQWEKTLAFTLLKSDPRAIPIDAIANDMYFDTARRQLLVLAPERNRVLFISVADRKIVGDAFTGSDPCDLVAADRAASAVWVSNRSSKSLSLINLISRKVDKTITLVHSPLNLAVTRENLWFITPEGRTAFVPMSGTGEEEAPLTIRSLAYNPARGNLLCGSSTSWLCEVDTDRLASAARQQGLLQKQADDYLRQSRSGTASQSAYQRLLKQQQDNRDQIERSVKQLNKPSGSDFDYTASAQKLVIDAAHGRVFFNRCALDLKDCTRILGVFKAPSHSLQGTPAMADFYRKNPGWSQIIAVSPDGTVAASGTHLYSTSDFTVLGELPVPTATLAFDSDDRTLWLGDQFNRQVVAYDYRPADWTPPPPPAPVEKPTPKAPPVVTPDPAAPAPAP